MADERSLSELLWDYGVYAPIGLAAAIVDELPRLTDKGKERAANQIHTARMIGKLAVGEGKRQMDKLFGVGHPSASPASSPPASATTRATPPSAPGSSTGGLQQRERGRSRDHATRRRCLHPPVRGVSHGAGRHHGALAPALECHQCTEGSGFQAGHTDGFDGAGVQRSWHSGTTGGRLPCHSGLRHPRRLSGRATPELAATRRARGHPPL